MTLQCSDCNKELFGKCDELLNSANRFARSLLIDYVMESEYAKVLRGDSSSCSQYTFKLAVLVYVCERLGLKREFPKELELMHEQLSAAQRPSGGVSHFYDVDLSTKRITPGPDATGEATAIFMLAKTIVAQ